MVDKPFIGKELVVEESTNESYLSMAGIVVDETKNTFVIKLMNEEKTILKKGSIFSIGGTIISGDKITKRLEERIKTRRTKR